MPIRFLIKMRQFGSKAYRVIRKVGIEYEYTGNFLIPYGKFNSLPSLKNGLTVFRSLRKFYFTVASKG
jgi:hypothetical protein